MTSGDILDKICTNLIFCSKPKTLFSNKLFVVLQTCLFFEESCGEYEETRSSRRSNKGWLSFIGCWSFFVLVRLLGKRSTQGTSWPSTRPVWTCLCYYGKRIARFWCCVLVWIAGEHDFPEILGSIYCGCRVCYGQCHSLRFLPVLLLLFILFLRLFHVFHFSSLGTSGFGWERFHVFGCCCSWW